MSTKLSAGLPYTLPVADPVQDGRYYAQIDGKLECVRYIGRDGTFDSYRIHAFQWITGVNAGETDRSYSVIFWRKPSKAEKQSIWSELTEYEQDKLVKGGYKGLRSKDYAPRS